MRHPLRYHIYRRLIAATLACGLLSGVGVAVAGAYVFRHLLSDAESAAYREAQSRFGLFDLLVSRVESENRMNGRRALASLASRFPRLADVSGLSFAALHAIAVEHGVNELYFISPELTIVATSFPPDRGFDMRKIENPEFLSFLAPILGSGRFADQRLSQSAMTGEVNNYQYYGPIGADYILEVSTRLDDMVSRVFPELDYGKLVEIAFNYAGSKDKDGLVAFTDCLFVTAGTIHSVVLEREVDPAVGKLIRKAEAGTGEASGSSSGHLVKVRRLNFELRDYDFADKSYGVFEVDQAPMRAFFLSSALVALLVGAGVALVAFLALRYSFSRKFTGRVEALEKAMASIGAGAPLRTLDDGEGDEISSIGRSADSMVAELKSRSSELSAFARRLEEEIAEGVVREERLSRALEENQALVREVNHRVNNNLQVLLSLVDFQAQESTCLDTREALARTKARLLTMSLVQDQLLSAPSHASLDMDTVLSGIAASVRSAHPESGPGLSCEVEARGVFMPADRALSLTLAASELLDNAYGHGFAGRREGRIMVSLRAEDEAGFDFRVADNGSGGIKVWSLGLRIVEAMAAQLGASLEIDSPPGKGTAVRLHAGDKGREGLAS